MPASALSFAAVSSAAFLLLPIAVIYVLIFGSVPLGRTITPFPSAVLYATTFDFLKRAKAIGLPMSELITDKYPLEEINEALKKNLAMTGLKIAVVNK